MGIDWGEKHAKSFGNGILRISVMDFIKLVATIVTLTIVWQDLKHQVKKTGEQLQETNKKVDEMSDRVYGMEVKVEEVSDQVLVLKTVAKTTSDIKNRVRNIQNEEVFDSDVTQIKVKQ